MPAGNFSARDGRPFDVADHCWKIDGKIAAVLIAQAKALGQDILIDYDHQTLNAAKNGKPAPAAGWFNGDEIEWREGQGLFVKPRWDSTSRCISGESGIPLYVGCFPL